MKLTPPKTERKPMAVRALAEIERRGLAMRAFCERIRARGSRAVVEEDEDLVWLRLRWRMVRASLRAGNALR